jgi:predicted transcriptional regulator
LPKSKLTTAQMRRLRSAGIKLDQIAKLAGITPNGVRNRLRSARKRKSYRFSSRRLKTVYVAKQKQRQRDYQRQSLKHAENFGEWTPAEIRYLEKNASVLTRLEIAISLQRTYYAVSHYINRHGIETRK